MHKKHTLIIALFTLVSLNTFSQQTSRLKSLDEPNVTVEKKLDRSTGGETWYYKGEREGLVHYYIPYNFDDGSDWSKSDAVSYFKEAAKKLGNKYGEDFVLDMNTQFYEIKGVDSPGGHCYAVFFKTGNVLYRVDLWDSFYRPDTAAYRFEEK